MAIKSCRRLIPLSKQVAHSLKNIISAYRSQVKCLLNVGRGGVRCGCRDSVALHINYVSLMHLRCELQSMAFSKSELFEKLIKQMPKSISSSVVSGMDKISQRELSRCIKKVPIYLSIDLSKQLMQKLVDPLF